MADGERLLAGLDKPFVSDLAAEVARCKEQRFDFLCTYLFHNACERDDGEGGLSRARTRPATRSDRCMDSKLWSTAIVGKVSDWIRPDAAVKRVRRKAELALAEELRWASHLPLTAVLLPQPCELNEPVNYGRLVNQFAQGGAASGLQLWVRIRMLDRPTVVRDSSEAGIEDAARAAWRRWDTLRALCEQHQSMYVALELGQDLPGSAALNRWLGEPVKAIFLPTDIFLTNKAGFPALSRRHQAFVKEGLRHGAHLVIQGQPCHPQAQTHGVYLQYLEHLHSSLPALSEVERFSTPFNDYLQAPLQPLMDNLESQTYETFEMDPVKYDAYEEAVARALSAGHAVGSEVVLMVLGAGRGPLVHASLTAAARTGHRLRVYAVEKNPNAVITLRNRAITDGWDNVTIISSDMRKLKEAPAKADIIVSELLGSFGDNELSPECLDGAQWLLKEGTGVCIPMSYTSYLAPLTSSKLWNDVKAYSELKYFETAFVVKFHNVYVAARPQPVFTFAHPNPEKDPELIDNTRSETLTFVVEEATTIHGFAGYFDSQLFADVRISIHPETHSPNMFSWFPLYFPLRTPLRVAKGERVTVHMWRCSGGGKVWYEWSVTEPVVLPVHNPNGRSYYIGL